MDVTIYTRSFCGYCSAAKQLLEEKGVAYTEFDATFSPNVRREMMDRSGRMTFPQIFVGERHIGGYNEIRQLEQAGSLDTLLAGRGS